MHFQWIWIVQSHTFNIVHRQPANLYLQSFNALCESFMHRISFSLSEHQLHALWNPLPSIRQSKFVRVSHIHVHSVWDGHAEWFGILVLNSD
mmetsp:Transcript_81670/g.144066  ORF Transcript_81670/g.144066 Transcript_81670/m.144066 type:complete len:92 (-) Transcript_81670:3230-3505(-)